MRNELVNVNSPTSISNQLHVILAKEIEAGVYPSGERFPSERALAERFGVSRPSVREAIAQLLAEGFLFRTVGRGTFISEQRSEPERSITRTSRQISFWISESIFHFVQPGYNQILTGVTDACRQRGYRVQFHSIDETKQSVDLNFSNGVGVTSVDGNLVVGGVSRHVLERLRRLDTPLLLADLLVAEEELASIQIDYASGTRQAIEYLQELGHTDISFIGFPGSQKYEAFWQSLEILGLPYSPRYVQFLSVSDLAPGMLAGYQSMQQMIARKHLPSAILASNDYVALGALEALKIAEIHVPDAISVIGYDDLTGSTQQLTTIKVDLLEFGRTAAQMLLDQIEKKSSLQNQVLVPVELVVRGTTGPVERKHAVLLSE